MTDQFTTIENVEIEFFYGIKEDGDYYTTSFIYPPSQFFNPDAVTIADTKYHKDSVYVKSKDDGTLSRTNPLDWNKIKIPTRAIVKVKRNGDTTLFANDITIVDGDISIIAAGPHRPGTPKPGYLTQEEWHERHQFVYDYTAPRKQSSSPPRFRQL
jgi:hypothetical protein